MNNLTLRSITGLVYVGLTVACLLWSQWSAVLFIATIVFFSSIELLLLLRTEKTGWNIPDAFLSTGTFLLAYFNQNDLINPGYFNGIFVLIVLIYGALFLFRAKDSFLGNLNSLAVVVIYIALPLSFLLKSGSLEFHITDELLPYEGKQVLLVFILIWVCDSFAYVTGRLFGKTPLMLSVSPGKTVEGLLGGTLVTVLIAYFFGAYFIPLTPIQFVLLALLVVIFGTVGDLFESLIKRTLGVKDSGKSLPGHGGFLDRFDSILFAAPAVYAYLKWYVM
ncbi:MAG: phosphatidate cytidylyltransferase [Flavobacteriales bacterium]|nr:phosphatidate cytidylyltransferase [Flavobacteriales bacterium]